MAEESALPESNAERHGTPRRRKRRRWRIALLVVLVLLAGFWGYAWWPANNRIVASPETTAITSPLNPDGTVDYLAYVNARRVEGVAPENNAFVLLLDAYGPTFVCDDVAEQLYDAVGHRPGPGPYFQYFELDSEPATPLTFPIFPDPDQPQPVTAGDLLDQAMAGPWRPQDLPAVSAWLDEQTKPLKTVVAATRCPKFFYPLLCEEQPPCYLNVLVISQGRMRSSGKALTARAMRHLGTGQAASAVNDLLAAHRLAALLPEEAPDITRLTSYAMHENACKGAIALIGFPDVDAKALRTYLDTLQALPPVHSPRQSLYNCRFLFLDSCQMLWRNPQSPLDREGADRLLRNVDWNIVMAEGLPYYDDMLTAAMEPDTPAGQAAQTRLDAFFRSPDPTDAQRFLMLNRWVFGRWTRRSCSLAMRDHLLSILLPSLGGMLPIYHASLARRDVVRVGLALRLFGLEQGRFPKTLDELTGTYLPELPQDVCTGRPLVYKPTPGGFVVYSVGPNRVDDGGVTDDGYDPGRDDIAVRFNVPKAEGR